MKSGGLCEHGVSFRLERSGGHFGVHLTLDGYGGSPQRLSDRDAVQAWLEELPDLLGMFKLAEPVLVSVDKLSEKDPGGLTGFVLIAESHISIHTFPARRFVSADVYTCQNALETDRLLENFYTTFDLEAVEHNLIIRGTHYSRQELHGPLDLDPYRPRVEGGVGR